MNKCINLKQKLDKTIYCKKLKKQIKISDCSNCKYKSILHKENKKITARTNKLANMERKRKSIFTDDLNHCIICRRYRDNLHEVFFGSNRLNSIKYNVVIPLCLEHHLEIHKNSQLQDMWHKKAQIRFNQVYPDLDFKEIFKRNYL